MHVRLFSKVLTKETLTPLESLASGLTSYMSSHRFKRPFTTEVSQLRPKTVITSEELLNLIASYKRPNEYFLFDVREIEERRKGIIPTSIWVPLAKVESMLKMTEESFKNNYKFEKFKKDDHLIFHCHSGKRSAIAQQMAENQGYKNSQNYLGSWHEFSEKHPEHIQFDNLLS